MTDQVAGTVLSERYALEDRIGVGGMATVYRAIDLTTGRRVAVKILSREFLARNPKEADRNVKRFRREAEILRLLVGNPYVVQIIEHGVATSGDHFIAMELLEGEQLRFYIGRGKAAMGLRTFAYHAKHLIRGLMDIHAKNLIHRDLAPDNVVIVKTREGLPWPKFLDFGIGKSLADELDQVTQMLTIMGKPQYFSPEQAQGEELGTRSDVYALGVLLYEMLTGFVPIEVHGLTDLRKIQKDAPAPISLHREGARLPADLQEVIMRCLEKESEKRPTLDDVLAAVESFSERLDSGEEFPLPGPPKPLETAGPPNPAAEAVTHQAVPGHGQAAREFAPGATIGRFQVRERIGRGGMGLVYLAWDPILQREVAIKVATRVEEEKARRAILREARASSHLRSENVVTIYDAGTEAGAPYIAMEYVRGRTLAHIIEEEGPLTGERFWKIARGILDGLIYAHGGDKPVIHRDLKPANILVAGDVAKIADFGIATVTAAQHLTIGGRDQAQTGGGGGEGSVLTLSPEQANNKPADHRSDVYSLGCLFYMMVTGKAPFQGNQIAVLYQHVTKTPDPPSKVKPGLVPAGLDAVIMKCLEKDPAKRYQSVQAVKADLEPLFGPARPARSGRRSGVPVAAAYVVLALAGILAVAILARKLGPTARVFTVVEVGGTSWRSDRPGFSFVTQASPLDVEIATQEGGDVRATLTTAGVAPVVQTSALGAGRTTKVRINLPEVPGRGVTTYRLVLERPDNPDQSRMELTVVRDSQRPTVTFRAYGVLHDPKTTALIRVLRIEDLSAVVEDPGGFDEEGTVTRLPVRWDENPHQVRFTRKREDSERGVWTATVAARDRAQNADKVEQRVQVITPAVVLKSPKEGRAIGEGIVHVELQGRIPDRVPPIPGLDPNDLDLGNGAFAARIVVGSRPSPVVPLVRVPGGYSGDLPLPPGHPAEFEFEIEPLFEGEPLPPTRHRFDSVPPIVIASCGGTTVSSAMTYSRRPTLFVQVQESKSEEVACRLEDGPAGVDGATVQVRIGDADAVVVPVDADGGFSLPSVQAEEFVVKLEAADQAGNRASTEFVVIRKGLQVTSIQVGAREADAEGRVFVQDDVVSLRVAAVGVPQTDQAWAKLFADDGVEQESVKLDRLGGSQVFGTSDLRLFPEGAASVARRLRVVFGNDETSSRTYSPEVKLICDREPPSISVTIDGTNEEMRGTRVVNRFPALRVRVTDNVALAERDPRQYLSWVRSNETARDLVIQQAAPATRGADAAPTEVTFLVGPPPGPPSENRYAFRVAARDRAGRTASREFVLRVRPPDVALLSVAGRTSLARFGESAANPLKVQSETLAVSVRAPTDPALSCTMVVKAFPDDGMPNRGDFPLSSDPEKPVLDFVVSLPRPVGDRLVERGRLVFLLEDGTSSRPEELATIYYLLDRDLPSWTVIRGTRVLGEAERRDWIRVADLADLRIVANDGPGAGFEPGAVDDPGNAVGKLEQTTPDQVTLWLKDDGSFRGPAATRRIELDVLDAAGNKSSLSLKLARSKDALEIKRFIAGGADPIFRNDVMVVREPKLTVVIDDEAVGFQSVQWVVKRDTTTIGEGVVYLREDRPLPSETIEWRVAEGAEPYLLEFHAQGTRGTEREPFHRVRVLVDTTPPSIYLHGAGRIISKDDRASLEDFEDLRLEVSDAGADVAPGAPTVEVVSSAGERIAASVSQARDSSLLRIVPPAPVAHGHWSIRVAAADRLGNADERVFRVVVGEPVRGSASTDGRTSRPSTRAATRPGQGGDRTVTSDALREKDEERCGLKFRPVWTKPDRTGPPSFFMSQTEVTNEQFLRFVEALKNDGKDPIPRELRSLSDLTPVKKKVDGMGFRFADFRRDPGLPVVDVDSDVAQAFAAWTGGRLPARSEWVGAAGKYLLSEAEYPVYLDHGVARSGEYWMRDPSFAVFHRRGLREARRQPVAELVRAQANSPFGIVGFAGNVAEWVTEEPGSRRVLGTMGGSFQYPYTNEVNNPRLDRSPRLSTPDAGIRVLWPAQVKAP
jgi:eukaryotic-like serine/threonine-protein kinase